VLWCFSGRPISVQPNVDQQIFDQQPFARLIFGRLKLSQRWNFSGL
jgi:hypothetical protein